MSVKWEFPKLQKYKVEESTIYDSGFIMKLNNYSLQRRKQKNHIEKGYTRS